MELNTATQSAATAIAKAPAKASGIDIASLLSADAAPVEKTFTVTVLRDADGDHAAGFDIVGKNSTQYRDAVRAASVVAIKRSQTKSQQIDAKTDVGASKLYDLGEDRNIKLAKAVVVGLPGFVSQGAPLEVNDATLDALFAKFPIWVDQIINALEVDANFLAI